MTLLKLLIREFAIFVLIFSARELNLLIISKFLKYFFMKFDNDLYYINKNVKFRIFK